jgi:hypothetical protein
MKSKFLKTAKIIVEQNGLCGAVSCEYCPYAKIIKKNEVCKIQKDDLLKYCKIYIAENEMEKIQMTEDQAREFVNHLWINHGIKLSVGYLKESGYIKKSIVDEAEEMLKDWLNGHDVKIDVMVSKALEAMDFLKAENLKLKTLDK